MAATVTETPHETATTVGRRGALNGRSRVVIENVTPQIDGGRFPVKRTLGDTVRVEADVFNDGHDRPAALLMFRHEDDGIWHEVRMQPLVGDRFWAEFTVDKLGRYVYTVGAWVDRFRTWRHDLLSESRYLWNGPSNYVELDPGVCPAHIFRLRRKTRTEREFEYFM